MKNPILEDLRAELDHLRGQLDHLRVQANLGKKELDDKLREIGEKLEPGQRRAKERIAALAKTATREADTLVQSLQAGWDELRRTHRELSRKAADEKGPDPKRK